MALERAYGAHLPIDPPAVIRQLGAALLRLPFVLREEVGLFGSLDTTIPLAATGLWAALLLALVAVALRVSAGRERLMLAMAVVGGLAVPVGFSALLVTGTGFDVQGRHILPLAVLVPLLAGEIVSRHQAQLPARAVRAGVAALVVSVAVLHLVAWYWNARRQSVGTGGTLWFVGAPAWSPPGSWWPWLAAAVAGAVCLVLLAGRAPSAREEVRNDAP